MSWQAYVDEHLMCEIEGNHLSDAAIIGHDGSVWAQSANFPQVWVWDLNLMIDFCFCMGLFAVWFAFLKGFMNFASKLGFCCDFVLVLCWMNYWLIFFPFYNWKICMISGFVSVCLYFFILDQIKWSFF